jgi:hypothetical protein
MERAERDTFGDRRDDGLVDQYALGEFFAAVYDAVADRPDFFQGVDDAVITARQLFDDGVDGLGMGRQGISALNSRFSPLSAVCLSRPSMPMRSQMPLAATVSVSMSNSWYFKDELPALMTNTFIFQTP